MMKTLHTRLCIYPKDVQRITGKCDRSARDLLQKIREKFRKEEHQFVSIEEFCQYTGLKIDQVRALLTD